jgi:hypothetical protein
MQYDLDHTHLTSLSGISSFCSFEINDTISLLTTTRITHGHLSLTISTAEFLSALSKAFPAYQL